MVHIFPLDVCNFDFIFGSLHTSSCIQICKITSALIIYPYISIVAFKLLCVESIWRTCIGCTPIKMIFPRMQQNIKDKLLTVECN